MQQQLQWSAACQWALGWMGGGAGGEGVCGRGSGGVRQLMVRAPAGHTGASRWRTSEPPHSSTKTLPTQAPCSQFQPKSLGSLFAFWFSRSLSVCLNVSLFFPSFLPDSFSFFSFLIQLIQIQINLPFDRVLFSHFQLHRKWRVLCDCVFSTFSSEGLVFSQVLHPLSALSLLNPFT